MPSQKQELTQIIEVTQGFKLVKEEQQIQGVKTIQCAGK